MNLNQNFSILFWLKKSKMNKLGLVPIWARITLDGRRSEFSTQKQINPKYWDAANGKVLEKCIESKHVNDYLTLLKANLLKHYNILLTTKDLVTSEDVKKSYKGVKPLKQTFLELFRQFNQHLLERREIGSLSSGRLKRFQVIYVKCKEFIKYKFKKSDVLLEEVKLNFIAEFVHYLRRMDGIMNNSAMKYASDLKQVMKHAVTLAYIPSNPFVNFKCLYNKVEREFLDQYELDTLYKKEFNIARLEEVCDCYLFCCYTGYAYSDAEALTIDDVCIGIDGELWIIRNRKKTNTTENVPLLQIPYQIIQKYKNHEYCKTTRKLLPMKSNQRYNAYLKEVADLCGIKKNLTTHTARHTFATTVLLMNDVPMETTMELLGHTDIRTTQIYGKIVQKKISTDMQKLKNKLSLSDTKKSNNVSN